MKKIIMILFSMLMFLPCVKASVDLTPSSKSAILIEASTGKVLYEKNINEKRSPASMTKIMTFLLVMEAIESNKISLDHQVFISKNASGMGGTQIFIKENTYVSVSDLIKGLGIASANDAAVALAELVGGTEDNFVNMMNEKAKELGCKNTNFMNPHGLDEENHYTTAYDLSIIAKELVKYDYAINITGTYEEYITVSGENHWLVNTNKLVKFYKGIDGLKTGYTDNAKYCLTATMKKNNMRLISVVMGVENKDNRSSDTIALMEYGYSMYGTSNIFKKDEYSNTMYIPNSRGRTVKYYLEKDVDLVVDKNRKDINYKTNIKLNDVKAPINKNDIVGKLIVEFDNNNYEYNLIVKEDIKKATYLNIIANLFTDIVSGKVNIFK